MNIPRTRIPLLIAAVVGLTLGVSACAPGAASPGPSQSLGTVSKKVSSSKITLTEWDQNTDGGMDAVQKKLNAAFHAKYPNITIKRVSHSFSDLKTTLKLALSGGTPPDVVQANQGHPDMGAFVAAGLLRPINDYATLYGWDSYYSKGLLKLNSFSADGKTWQGDNLYGVSQTGEYVGVYYNKKILAQLRVSAPTTLAELEDDFEKAKAAGVQPLSYGDIDKSPGIHIYGVVQAALVGADKVDDLVTGASGSWTDQGNVTAAATVADWAAKGWIASGSSGISSDQALASFVKGGSAFDIDGTWAEATIEKGMGEDGAGLTTLVPEGSRDPVTQGGEGLAWAMTSKTKNADAAAAYIDFITNSAAAKVLLTSGNLPAVLPKDYSPAEGTLAADVASQYRKLSAASTIVPYLDYSTPTMYDTLTAAVQNLVGGQSTPEQFAESVQKDYAAYMTSAG